MKVIAIDPGYGRCGIAVLEKENNKEHLIYSECFETSSHLSLNERLFLVGQKVSSLITQYSPEFLGIEGLFFCKKYKNSNGCKSGKRGYCL